MSLAGDLRMLVERRQAEEGASDFLRLVQIAADQIDRLEAERVARPSGDVVSARVFIALAEELDLVRIELGRVQVERDDQRVRSAKRLLLAESFIPRGQPLREYVQQRRAQEKP